MDTDGIDARWKRWRPELKAASNGEAVRQVQMIGDRAFVEFKMGPYRKLVRVTYDLPADAIFFQVLGSRTD